MRTRRYNWQMRAMSWVAIFSIAGMALLVSPAQARQLAERQEMSKPHFKPELASHMTQTLTPEQWKAVDAQRAKAHAQKEASAPDTKPLTDKEMKSLHGRGSYRNKYLVGTMPWHRSFHDVNMCTGNLFKSFTDIQVSPAKGAGLALQRTYNSNDDRPGPFGIGWTHAYDIRMEETANDSDPSNSATYDPSDTNFVRRTDFFGHPHRYHRDVDGLYTPPPYLYDELDSHYNQFLNGQGTVQDDTQIGEDGTIKHFVAKGDDRVCDSIQDRYGNTTTLEYDNPVQTDGQPQWHALLTKVTDPSQRHLDFTWANIATNNHPVYRIVQVDSPLYSVVYTYYTTPATDAKSAARLYNLKSVTLDASHDWTGGNNVQAGHNAHEDRTTSFDYDDVTYGQSTSTGEYGVLNSITDPLGHAVSYGYEVDPYYGLGTISVRSLQEPAGLNGTMNWKFEWTDTFLGDRAMSVVDANPNRDEVTLYAVVDSDSMLRKTSMEGYGKRGGYYTVYDSANQVKSSMSAQIGYEFRVDQVLGVEDATYWANGKPQSSWTEGFDASNDADSWKYPNNHKDVTYYYDSSRYFMQKKIIDRNGKVAMFGVGAKEDPNIGNRGSILWVKDAQYGDGDQTQASGTCFQYAYNNAGQKTDETNEGVGNSSTGVVTHFEYYTASDPVNPTTQIKNTEGTLKSVTQDPGSNPHLRLTTTMAYDEAGHVLLSIDPNGNKRIMSYTNLGQPDTVNFYYPGVQNPYRTIIYHYTIPGRSTSNGRIESIDDSSRGTTTMTYEAGSDRVSSVSDPGTDTISYTYLPSGERATVHLDSGGTWTYGYNVYLQYSGIYNQTPLLLPKDDPGSMALLPLSVTDDQGRRVDYYNSTEDDPAHGLYTNITSYPAQDGRLQVVLSNQTFDVTVPDNPRLQSYCMTQYHYVSAQYGYIRPWLDCMQTTFYQVNKNSTPPDNEQPTFVS